MFSSPLKRNGAPLTDNEKSMIINVYNYLSGANSVGKSHQTLTLRKQVAEVVGVAERTVASVVSDWNKRKDGASYHKRRIESIPTSNTKKGEIIDWLTTHNIAFSSELRRPELLKLIQMNKEKVPFSCVEIAKQYNHQVFFTPPYHCELQPIEGIWAVVKGEVARSSPHANLLSVRNTLLDAFKTKIYTKVIVGFWRRRLKMPRNILSQMKIYS